MQVTLTVHTQKGFEHDVEIRAAPDATAADLVAQLAVLTGSPGDAVLSSGGRPLPATALIGGPGLRSGCCIGLGPTGRRSSLASSVLKLHVIGGPDAGQIIALARGRQVLGRADDADLTLDDPDVSRHHLELHVDHHGVSVRDLASTNGSWLDEVELGAGARLLQCETLLRIGNSTMTVVVASDPPAPLRSDATGVLLVNRPPRIVEPRPGDVIEFPAPAGSGTGPKLRWLAAVLPALMGIGLALSTRNITFLAFALLSPVAMFATTAAERRDWRRSRRRERSSTMEAERAAQSELNDRLAAEVHRRRRDFPDAAAVLQTVSTPDCRLWERRPADVDFLAVRLGLADQSAQLSAMRVGQRLPDPIARTVPATVALSDGALGLAGPPRLVTGVGRWVVGQLTALHSPRDLTLIALVDDAAEHWRWLRWMPASVSQIVTDPEEYAQAITELLAVLAQRQGGHPAGRSRWCGTWTVLLVDPARSVASAPGLRTLLDDGPAVGITAVFVDEDARLLPPSCRSTARIVSDSGAHVEVAVAGRATLRNVIADRVSPKWADTLARQLAPLRDSDADASSALPKLARLMDLIDLGDITPGSLLRAWSAPSAIATPIGLGASGTVEIDLVRDGPHVLIAGSTGSGKSQLLRTIVAGLASRHAPDEVSFVLMDYKGGAAFAECADLPHVLGLVTDLDSHLTSRALTSLEAELRRREAAFAQAGVSDLAAYLHARRPHQEVLSRLVLVVDEFASLAEELPAFLTGLLAIAQRGRSLGVHLVLATQRPAGVVSPEIKANMALRVALRVTDSSESTDVIGTDAASRISKKTPGRAIAKVAGGLTEFQTAIVAVVAPSSTAAVSVRTLDSWNRAIDNDACATPGKDDLQLLRDSAREASLRLERPLPAPPWLPPLPAVVASASLERDVEDRFRVAFGRIDDPREQRQTSAEHDLGSGGSLGFIGAPRSGRTSALRTVIGQAASQLSSDDLHVYIIDCAGGSLRSLQALPQCGAVLTREDAPSVSRLISRLVEEAAGRLRSFADLGVSTAAEARARGRAVPAVLVGIDGWESLVVLSEEHDAGRTADAVLQLLRDCAAAGYTMMITGDRAVLGVRTAAALTRKFILEMVDRSDYLMAGISALALPVTFTPGRCVSAEGGREVQLAVLGTDPGTAAQCEEIRRIAADQPLTTGPVPIAVRALPTRVVACDIATAGEVALPGRVVLGLGGDDASAVWVNLAHADGRFLIAGPARSGRSSALVSIADQTLLAGGRLLIAAPHRSPLTSWSARRGLACLAPDDTAWNDSKDNLSTAEPGQVNLLLIDDTEQFTDAPAGDLLSTWIAQQRAGSAVVASARSEDLMVSFRGLAVDIRRSRTGLLLQPTVPDGDLLGVRVTPHRSRMPPGRGLLITEEYRQCAPDGLPVQLALP